MLVTSCRQRTWYWPQWTRHKFILRQEEKYVGWENPPCVGQNAQSNAHPLPSLFGESGHCITATLNPSPTAERVYHTTVGWILIRAILTVSIPITGPALGDAVPIVTLETGSFASVVNCWKKHVKRAFWELIRPEFVLVYKDCYMPDVCT